MDDAWITARVAEALKASPVAEAVASAIGDSIGRRHARPRAPSGGTQGNCNSPPRRSYGAPKTS